MNALASKVRFASQLAALISILLAASACTSVQKGFSGTEVEDMTPFAQTTVEVMTVENIQLRDNELLYLRFFVDESFSELDELQAGLATIDTFRDRVVAYSVDLVRITELYSDDSDRVAAYADGIDAKLHDQFVAAGLATEQEWDLVLSDIREQTDLLAALRAVQPLVNRAGEFYEGKITEIETEQLLAVRAEFDARIQSEYGDLLRFLEMQYARRDEALEALLQVDAMRRGDDGAIDVLRRNRLVADLAPLPSGEPSGAQLDAINTAMRQYVIDTNELLRNVETDLDGYKHTRSELDKKETEVIAALAVARLQFQTWARAHQALANGVKNPGKWMELSIKAAKLVGDVI